MMKKTTLLIIAVAAVIAGCTKPAETSTRVGTDFMVERLFTHENCTVFRFRDGGYNRYYTNCKGATEWSESCGKNCTMTQGVY